MEEKLVKLKAAGYQPTPSIHISLLGMHARRADIQSVHRVLGDMRTAGHLAEFPSLLAALNALYSLPC